MTLRWSGSSNSGTPYRARRHRIAHYFDCTWSSQWGLERARVSSLSPTGCYIETRISVPAEGVEISDLLVSLPTGPVSLRGTVVSAEPGIGFAMRFTQLDAPTLDSLNALTHEAGAHP